MVCGLLLVQPFVDGKRHNLIKAKGKRQRKMGDGCSVFSKEILSSTIA
jgi:hypothetical protein